MILLKLHQKSAKFEIQHCTNLADGLVKFSNELVSTSKSTPSNLVEVLLYACINNNTLLYLIDTNNEDIAKKVAVLTFNEGMYFTVNSLRTAIKAKTTSGVVIYIDSETEELIAPVYVGVATSKIPSSILSEIVETDIPFEIAVKDLQAQLSA